MIPTSLRMPGEWEKHHACLILYPHNPETFRLSEAQEEFLGVANAIANEGKENVFMLCKHEKHAEELRQKIGHHGKINIHLCDSDDTWVRDTGPTCCWNQETNELVGLDWDFNAYGGPVEGCYWPCDNDRNVAKHVCDHILEIKSYQVSIVLEGGSIHTDGEGTLLVTEECLLNPNRNPQYTKEEIEHTLKQSLGVDTIIWLPNGLDADDDTNGHIDNFACFLKPGHVVLAWTDDETNDPENYYRCRIAESVLSSSKDSNGRIIQVHKLCLPPPLRYTKEEADSLSNEGSDAVGRSEGDKLAASYINFYISNNAIIVPQFGVEVTDTQARETLQKLAPDRCVVGVPSREILLGGGNIHCITQQVPARETKELQNIR